VSDAGPSTAIVPGRPDLAPGRNAGRRRLLPTLVVLAAIVVVVLGGFVVAAALAGPAGPPIDVAGLARVRPEPGWELAARGRLAGSWATSGGTIDAPPYARLTRGSANLDVVVVPGFVGPAEELARWYATEVLRRQLSHLSISGVRETSVDRPGAVGIRFAYLGVHRTAIEGDVAVFVTGTTGVIFDAWAAQGALADARGDVAAMIEDAEVSP
jgi:hypothetical protein